MTSERKEGYIVLRFVQKSENLYKFSENVSTFFRNSPTLHEHSQTNHKKAISTLPACLQQSRNLSRRTFRRTRLSQNTNQPIVLRKHVRASVSARYNLSQLLFILETVIPSATSSVTTSRSAIRFTNEIYFTFRICLRRKETSLPADM